MIKLEVFIAYPHQPCAAEAYTATLNAVAETLKSSAVELTFSGEQITSFSTLENVIEGIRRADIALFDITGWNPNVFTELGIAIGLAKRHFLLLNSKDARENTLPFDTRSIDKIQYESKFELEAKILLLIRHELPPESGYIDSLFDSLKNRITTALTENPQLRLGEVAAKIGHDKALVEATLRAMVANQAGLRLPPQNNLGGIAPAQISIAAAPSA
jgi:hypothetical protein